ncbi:MAG: DUF6178 family protein [Bradymonadia bacterium]
MSTDDGQSKDLSPEALAQWQAEIGGLTTGGRLLDALISPKDAERRIQSLPTEDLHRAVKVIGLADAGPILALASGQQVQGMLDGEIWVKDALSLERMDPWLGALMHAGPEALTRHLLAQDDPIINWVVRRSVRVIAIEDPDSFDPPDTEHVVTPDNRMCVVFPDPDPRDLPMKVFLDVLMRTEPEYCYNLLVFSSAALDSVLQEEAYRWRSGRMADRGYVDYYDALRVYTAPRPDELTAAQQALPKVDGPVGYWMRPVVAPDERLAQAIATLDQGQQDLFHQGLAYVLNMALSADRIEAWDTEAAEPVFQRVRAGLALGLDALSAGDVDARADGIRLAEHTPSFIFRTGYGRMQAAARPLTRIVSTGKLRAEGGPADRVDIEPMRTWALALGDRHPQKPDGRPLSSSTDLSEAHQMARNIAALSTAVFSGDLAKTVETQPGIGALAFTEITARVLGLDPTQPLPASALEKAHRAMFSEGALTEAARAAAITWWHDRAPEGPIVALDMMLQAATEALAQVDVDALEARFVHLWIISA